MTPNDTPPTDGNDATDGDDAADAGTSAAPPGDELSEVDQQELLQEIEH